MSPPGTNLGGPRPGEKEDAQQREWEIPWVVRVRGGSKCCSKYAGRGKGSVGPGAVHQSQRCWHCNHRLHRGGWACCRGTWPGAVGRVKLRSGSEGDVDGRDMSFGDAPGRIRDGVAAERGVVGARCWLRPAACGSSRDAEVQADVRCSGRARQDYPIPRVSESRVGPGFH